MATMIAADTQPDTGDLKDHEQLDIDKDANHDQQPSQATTDTAQVTTVNATTNRVDGDSTTTAPTATPAPTAEKEQGSLVNTDTSAASVDHKVSKAGINGVHPGGSEADIPSSSSRHKDRKPSFMHQLIYILLPCIAPSKAFDIEKEEKTAQATSKKTKPPPIAEVATKNPDEKDVGTSAAASKRPEPIDTSVAAGFVLPVVPSQHTPTRSTPTDPTVIVPPTPHSHILPPDETGGVTSGAVQPPGSTGEESRRSSRHGTEYDSDEADESSGALPQEQDPMTDEDDEEERLIREGGAGIPIGPDGKPCPLLPSIHPNHKGRKCLVLDMDETLLHSSFKLIPQADYVIPVEIEHQYHNVYVIKRPGVDQFLQKMGELYEVVVFTASLSKYADPVLDKLDVHHSVAYRLFRESCYNHKGNYVKDLSRLGRPIDQTIILDNSPASYIFHPNNAVPVSSWFNDPHDTELTDLCPFLTDIRHVDDVRGILDGSA